MKSERAKRLKSYIFVLFECLNEGTIKLPVIYIFFLIFESIQFISLSAVFQNKLSEYSEINTSIYDLIVRP